jgi:hypothetical protein
MAFSFVAEVQRVAPTMMLPERAVLDEQVDSGRQCRVA